MDENYIATGRSTDPLAKRRTEILVALCDNPTCRRPKIKGYSDIGTWCPHCSCALFYSRRRKQDVSLGDVE